MSPAVFRALRWALLAALPASAQALCTSDAVPQPQAVLERFLSADCAACWRDPGTARAASDTLALDWVLPGAQGEKAPLSVVATTDALERIYFLERKEPARAAAFGAERSGAPLDVRLAQGEAFNDYVGVSLEIAQPGRDRWYTWLLLVENLPAGTEGSPVERNLVRNVFRPDWGRPMARGPGRLAETRSMRIQEGARPERLRLVALVHDQRGRIRAIAQTECR
jgi:hypothetical protein